MLHRNGRLETCGAMGGVGGFGNASTHMSNFNVYIHVEDEKNNVNHIYRGNDMGHVFLPNGTKMYLGKL